MVFHYKWPSEEIQIGDIGLQRVQSWQLKKKYLYPLKRQSVACFFIFLTVSFDEQKIFNEIYFISVLFLC